MIHVAEAARTQILCISMYHIAALPHQHCAAKTFQQQSGWSHNPTPVNFQQHLLSDQFFGLF